MIVDCAHYADGQRQHEGPIEIDEATGLCGEGKDGFAWVGLKEPSAEELDRVGQAFGLHELALEDARKAHQRPKLEDFDGSLFIVLKTARYDDGNEEVEFGEIHLFVGSSYVIAVRHGEASELGPARQRLEEQGDLLGSGPGAVVWAIVDKVVDDYVPVVAGVDQDIGEIEEQVFSDSRHNHAERIYKLKREVLEFHAATVPLLDPIDRLARGRLALIDEHLHKHFQDVHDHLLRVTEQVEGFRDLLTGVLEANLTQVNVRQNEDVRKISAWVAILAVPTAIAAIYGMNFDHMPELRWQYGYPLVLGLMLAICVTIHRAFKRAGWL